MSELTFGDLRTVNVARCEEVFHAIIEWSPTDWACAMAGECGEACNFIKKLRRLDGFDSDFDSVEKREELRVKIGNELADMVIYTDLLAKRLNEDLEHEAKIESKIPLMAQDAKFKFAEAKKLRRSYENIMERKLKKLGQKLAQFRTVPCSFIDGRPGIGDASVSTRLSDL